MKIGYFRDAIIREPRHGARWEVDLLQPPYVNDFEAAANLLLLPMLLEASLLHF